MTKQIDSKHAALRTAEIERDDLKLQVIEVLNRLERMNDEQLNLQVCPLPLG